MGLIKTLFGADKRDISFNAYFDQIVQALKNSDEAVLPPQRFPGDIFMGHRI